MDTTTLKSTPLNSWHAANGAKLVDFAGWSMPVLYDSIITEHTATREQATLFDVSHMGRFRFDGDQAAAFLDKLITRRVTNLKPGQIRYGLVTKEDGGVLDDILVYHLVDHDGSPYHALVVNAGNREKIANWIRQHGDDSLGVKFTDETLDTAMIAVQGPAAIGVVKEHVDFDLEALAYYTGHNGNYDGVPALVTRTGYTGEDGCEISVAASAAERIWNHLLQVGESAGFRAAGLGARDTLRLEAAMPLYGHELSEDINPFQAGLGFAVHFKERDFIGHTALKDIKSEYQASGGASQRVGLQLDGKRPPREHYPVVFNGETVGEVTSGTLSPTLNQPIAMALVAPSAAAVGTKVDVDIRGKHHPATVVELPFYKRST